MTPRAMLGRSVSSRQGHPSQKDQRVGARLSVVHWTSWLGVGRDANNAFPQKVSCYETSHQKKKICEAAKFFNNCRATKEG